MGLLTAEEEAAAIAIEFNPVRVGFHGYEADAVWTEDVLNLGVRPDALVQAMRARLEAAGGAVFERAALDGLEVCGDGVELRLSDASGGGGGSGGSGGEAGAQPPAGGARTLTARLVLDCMGHASPVVRQLRWGQKPDGVCLVVGGCAGGFDPEFNKTADVICTVSDSEALMPPSAATNSSSSSSSSSSTSSSTSSTTSSTTPQQLFWEAFPSSDGPDCRTTYMFAYMDAQPFRPSLLEMFEAYWRRLEAYQGAAALPPGGAEALDFKRLLFAFFPTYKASPLAPGFDRVLQVGDASGVQSPLSFGGFGALLRHLKRLAGAVDDALGCDALARADLALINAYSPSLSAAWMLQRAMTAARAPSEAAPAALINRMLGGNFASMRGLGDGVMRPFLQDVLQFGPLARTMAAQMAADPLFVPQLLLHIGAGPLIEWLGHVASLGAYAALHAAAAPAVRRALLPQLTAREQFRWRRAMEAWEYGSGQDYKM